MELTILGSGTAIPSLRRGAPGYLLRVGGDRIVFDTGSGTMRRLLGAGVRPDEVSHLFYSHNHLDHVGELAPWLFASRIPSSARTSPLAICGSAGFMRMLSGLRDLYGHWLEAASYELTLVTMRADGGAQVAGDGWTAKAFAVDHSDSSLGFRLTDASGATFAYTGDTSACGALVDLARDADLLLIEASSPDGMKLPGHLTPSEAGAVAREAGARRVVLTHFYPACEGVDMLAQLRLAYDGEAVLAEDGMTIRIGTR